MSETRTQRLIREFGGESSEVVIDADVTTHASDTTLVHGITDTSKLSLVDGNNAWTGLNHYTTELTIGINPTDWNGYGYAGLNIAMYDVAGGVAGTHSYGADIFLWTSNTSAMGIDAAVRVSGDTATAIRARTITDASLTDLVGIQSYISASHNISNSIGIKVSPVFDEGSVIAQHRSLYLESAGLSGGATITNRYGIYQEDTSSINYFAGCFDLFEHADWAAPGIGMCRLYARDNGSGKTQLVVRFPTGAVQVLATEP